MNTGKRFACAVLILFITTLPACNPIHEEAVKADSSACTEIIIPENTIAVETELIRSVSEAELLLTLPYARITHSHLQGGLYDGHYFYQTNIKFDKASNEEKNETYVLKYDMQAEEIAATSECLFLGHANDIAYNPDTNQILLVCNKPFYDQVGVLDPKTLELKDTITLPVKIFCLDYEPKRMQYAAGISGGQSFVILNEKFEVISPEYQPVGETEGYTTQGCCCDENDVYFLLHKKSDYIINVYDWDGKYIKTITIDISGEPENISIIDGRFYIMVSRAGAAIYRVSEINNR